MLTWSGNGCSILLLFALSMWSPQVESLDESSVRFYYFLSVLILLSSSFVSITAMMSFIAFMSVQNLSRSDLVREVEVGEVGGIVWEIARVLVEA